MVDIILFLWLNSLGDADLSGSQDPVAELVSIAYNPDYDAFFYIGGFFIKHCFVLPRLEDLALGFDLADSFGVKDRLEIITYQLKPIKPSWSHGVASDHVERSIKIVDHAEYFQQELRIRGPPGLLQFVDCPALVIGKIGLCSLGQRSELLFLS